MPEKSSGEVRSHYRRWESQRARLSHDVLKNKLIPMVSGLRNRLRGLIRTEESHQEWCGVFADQWQQFVHDSVALMAQFIAVCSPKAILEMPPLDSGAPITNIWLGAVAHRRWLLTAKPYVILADLDVALSACEVAWHALAVEMLEGDSAAADDPVIEIAAESFLQSLGGLAKVLAEIGRVPRYG